MVGAECLSPGRDTALDQVTRCTFPGCQDPECSGFHVWVLGEGLTEQEETEAVRQARHERWLERLRWGGGAWFPGD